jgi:thiaminase
MKAHLFSSLEPLIGTLDRFPFDKREVYGDWLAQTYYYVRHSTRLLAASAARFPQTPKGDTLHHRFGAHIGEEKKHERLLIHDLKALSLSLETLPEHASTRMFYEPQYFKIEHQSPVALFGYILPLEAIAAKSGPKTVERVKSAYGELSCSSFLRVHAEEDPDHVDKAFDALERLDADELALIKQNITQTVYAYSAMLADIRSRAL